jgi:hypothetical protein
MSNVVDVLNDIDGDVAYYNPSEDTSGAENKLLPQGTYEANVYKLTIKSNIIVKNQYLSDIYEAIYVIDGTKHPEYKNKQVKSKGYFRFKNPDPAKYPNLKDNQGNNKGYMIFTEACGFQMEKDDSGRYLLPVVMESDIAGNPVNIKVIHDKWTNSEGEERITPLAVNVFKSKVRTKALTEDELPF